MKNIKKKVFQTRFTDVSKKILGNCAECCIATVTGIPVDEIRLFLQPYGRCKSRLRSEGWNLEHKDGKPPKDGEVYLASYKTKQEAVIDGNTINHLVVWRNGKIIHDPRGENSVELVEIEHHYVIDRI